MYRTQLKVLMNSTESHFTLPSDSVAKNLPMQEMRVQSLAQEGPLKEEMATHSSILAWRIPWIEEPCGLQSMGL